LEWIGVTQGHQQCHYSTECTQSNTAYFNLPQLHLVPVEFHWHRLASEN